jgi:hypothetical protein
MLNLVVRRETARLLKVNLLPEQLLNELSEFYQIKVLERCNGTSHVPGSLLSIMRKSSRPFLGYAFNLIYISQNF